MVAVGLEHVFVPRAAGLLEGEAYSMALGDFSLGQLAGLRMQDVVAVQDLHFV